MRRVADSTQASGSKGQLGPEGQPPAAPRRRPGPSRALQHVERRHGSPLGEMRLWTDGLALTGLYFFDQSDCPPEGGASPGMGDAGPAPGAGLFPERQAAAQALLARACEELDAYFAGRLREFTVPVAWQGTPFQERVWRGLLDIPYGEVLAYGEFSRRLGLGTGHARAVGLANGANPVSLLVPCHRVIGASGQLVGYGGGLPRKRYLLALERGEAGQGELF